MLRRLLDSPWTYFTLAGLLALAALLSPLRIHLPSRPVGTVEDLAKLRESRPNVIFILVDTMRADHLSAYGYPRPTSPVMDDLARYGVRFARVEAQSSWTKSSMASIWTGRFPIRTGVLRFNDVMPPEALMPAEIFSQAGYATAGIWRNGWVAAMFGFEQGFDTYLKPTPEADPAKFEKRTPGASPIPGTDEDATRTALGFLENHGNEPFMLYVHYMDVHQYSYDAEAAALGFGTSLSDSYDAAIHWVDRNIAALLTHLEKNRLFEKTIVVIAADHGEGFREHGIEGHARSMYREVSEVPLIIALPFRLEPGIVVEPLVRNVDIWPTILDLAGLPPLPEADGRSLVPVIEAVGRGQDPGPSPPSYGYLDQNWGQVKLPPRPLITRRDQDRRLLLQVPEGSLELFDVASDPTEQRNLVEQRPDWIQELRPGLEGSLELESGWQNPKVEVDEMSREMLRALGYAVH